MELYNALDRLRLAIHQASGETAVTPVSSSMQSSMQSSMSSSIPSSTTVSSSATISTMIPTPIFVGGAPSQTVIVNNGAGNNDNPAKKDEKKHTSTHDNIITGVGMGIIAVLSTKAAASLYNRHRRNQAVIAAYTDVMTTYRTLFPAMPYLNSCGFTDIELQYTRWQTENGVLTDAKRVGWAAVSALGVIAGWRFDWPAVGWLSFAGLLYTGCRAMFDYLTAGPDAATEFAQAVTRTQHMVWAALQNKGHAPPATYQNVD